MQNCQTYPQVWQCSTHELDRLKNCPVLNMHTWVHNNADSLIISAKVSMLNLPAGSAKFVLPIHLKCTTLVMSCGECVENELFAMYK